MALRRFYLDEDGIIHQSSVNIRGELFHHIRDVCRFKSGDQFEVLNGRGEALLVRIQNLSAKDLNAEIVSTRKLPEIPKPYITLALSIPKLPKVDWIIEKCVELGAYEIRPFVSDYSFLRKESEISPNRLARWQKLVQAATQQSGRGDLMKIHPTTSLEKLLADFNRSPSTGGLFPYEGDAQVGLPHAIHALKEKKLDHIWLFVGSEGGFSLEEVNMFEKFAMKPVSMGEQILRVETACVALMSIIKYEIGALR